jgi:hypothetical protein
MLNDKLNTNATGRVVLIGTWHQYQKGTAPPECVARFRQLLSSLCLEHSIKAIAEEMSQDAMPQGVNDSIPATVADQHYLKHQYSDPSNNVRSQLGIEGSSEIELSRQMNGWSCTDTEFLSFQRAEYAKREHYWMGQITELNCWPLLFVCGADHTQPFANLLIANKFEVQIAVEEWKDVDMIE